MNQATQQNYFINSRIPIHPRFTRQSHNLFLGINLLRSMIYFEDGLPFFFGGHSFGGRCHGCSVALVVGVGYVV
jgi:hypothetical protein